MVPVVFVSIKPSPGRQRLMTKELQANNLVKQLLRKNKKTVFIDVYHKMLDKTGAPMSDIFIEDDLHMNAKGYAIWQKAIAPYLLK
jgi:lysophospholipase L1-like esterase